ncbi:MAG: hypothetical protein HY073_05305 [Deltaproteobacteria bacterium]|nr:hypothetical protein [Deltaproteobacteria bacterium]
MEMSVDHNDNFRLSYLQKGRTITTQDVQAKLLPDGGLNVYHVQIPEVAVKEGYDQVVMLPMSHDRCSVGHLVLLD